MITIQITTPNGLCIETTPENLGVERVSFLLSMDKIERAAKVVAELSGCCVTIRTQQFTTVRPPKEYQVA